MLRRAFVPGFVVTTLLFAACSKGAPEVEADPSAGAAPDGGAP
ncbi:hypothetical protein [Polyangium jinanense]|nr:hypothetical protein [Polyangium jinanense]